MSIAVYVACHKKFKKPFPAHRFLKYIEVGRYFHSKKIFRINDAEGDSISYKNLNYNELTALYWIWKNDNKNDIVGLCHYRRYFKSLTAKSRFSSRQLLKPKEIKHILQSNDMIAIPIGPFGINCLQKPPTGRSFKSRIHDKGSWISPEDVETMKGIILRLYGKKFATALDTILDRNWNYMLNMFISRKSIFDSYCAWLFPLLTELEKNINLEERVGQAKRIFGFWGEYLLNVYIYGKNLKVCGVEHIEKEGSVWASLKFKINQILKKIFKRNK